MKLKLTILPLIFLSFGFASSAKRETCPDAEAIAPCTCEEDEEFEEITVGCADDVDLNSLKKALKSLVGKKDVDLVLSDLTLGTLPSTIFEGIGIKVLDISKCNLDSLSDGGPVLSGLENTLEDLTITSSFTEDNVPTSLNFGHLRRLKLLELSYNVITELSNEWFENGPQALENLEISNNGIEKLGDRAFETLNSLKELYFDGNRAGPLKRSMFPLVPHRLEIIALDNNALKSLPEDLFSGMQSLRGVSLQNNRIMRLDQNTWQPVWRKLEFIQIDGNRMQCDSHLDWTINYLDSPEVSGACVAPPEVAQEDLGKFIKNKRFNPSWSTFSWSSFALPTAEILAAILIKLLF